MSKIILATIIASSVACGCESADTRHSYQPSDGRNLAPAMKDASHGDPQWPADIDRGGGGGTR